MLNAVGKHLAQFANGNVVHITEDLVFTDHAPDEGVTFSADT
ncbi:hypothetical protein YWA314_08108 [Yersinia enterocolitica subsp. enterocolitica WA-314]|nr:hypothetical protein YWA314_08108 [Yersinia enterocolitica subsp. enterocolitica WA-314]